MPTPLTIAGLPELASLSEAERNALLRSCEVPSPLQLWAINLRRGIFLAAVFFLLLHVTSVLDRLGGPLGAVVMVAAAAILTVVMHVVTITRIRGQLRMAIAEAAAGGLTPVCLACGFDCSGTSADRCPECGKPRLLPPNPGPTI